jgi:hypothetical protein
MARESSSVTHGWISDNAGVAFPFTFSSNGWMREWRVFDAGPWIGVASCSVKGDEMNLGEFQFRDDLFRPRSWSQKLRGQPPERVNYQRRGLGSVLLPLVIAHARQSGCRKINGIITSRDLAANPRLVAWYCRHGFSYSPVGPNLRVAGNILIVFT